MAGRAMSALNARFHAMQTVLPAKVVRRGVMLIIVTVLSPMGLTTLYTGSADPPCTATDCCAAAATLQTTRTNESTSAQQTLRTTDALQDALRIRQGSKRLMVIGSIVPSSSHGHRRAHIPRPVSQRHHETGRAPRSRAATPPQRERCGGGGAYRAGSPQPRSPWADRRARPGGDRGGDVA